MISLPGIGLKQAGMRNTIQLPIVICLPLLFSSCLDPEDFKLPLSSGKDTAAAQDQEASKTSLARQVTKEIEGNLLLEKHGMELVVTAEANGFLELNLSDGPKELREGIAGGLDLSTSSFTSALVLRTDASLRALTDLRNLIEYLKGIDGVKAISLTATRVTRRDQGIDLLNEARDAQEAKEYANAERLFLESASFGESDAMNEVGLLYLNEETSLHDTGKGITWLRQGVEAGNRFAADNLASRYLFGNGVPRSDKEAIAILLPFAEKGDARSQNSVAWIFASSYDKSLHDGEKAIHYANQAHKADPEDWTYLDTLAAAQARNGSFESAISSQRRSLQFLEKANSPEELIVNLSKESLIEDANERLEFYRNQTAYEYE